MKNVLIVLIFSCCSSVALSQNLSGFWKGNLTMGGGCFSVNNIELQLRISGDSVVGDSYQYDDIHNYVKKSITGKYIASEKKLIIHESAVTTFHIPHTCSICVKNFYLTYSRKGNVEILTGTWDGKILGSNADCSTGPIVLKRIKESAFKEIPEILVDTGTIRLDFYDNAQIDGDSITVLVNKNVVVSQQRLSMKPITTYITIDLKRTFQEIEMVADNLGSIPPNTAMLIITTASKKFQLFLTSTESKSAMVRFVYDKRYDSVKRE